MQSCCRRECLGGDMFRAIVLIAALAISTDVRAETLAVCGAVDGHGYFAAQGIVPTPEAGWTPDRISDGAISLTRDGDEFDILFKDGTGVYSSRAQGAEVIVMRAAADEAAVLVIYEHNDIEIYQFIRERTGRGRVALLQSRSNSSITKASLMVGQCTQLELFRD